MTDIDVLIIRAREAAITIDDIAKYLKLSHPEGAMYSSKMLMEIANGLARRKDLVSRLVQDLKSSGLPYLNLTSVAQFLIDKGWRPPEEES